jgi:hypothetical protein
MCRGVECRPREYLESRDRGTRLVFQVLEKRSHMYRPYHGRSTGRRVKKKEGLQKGPEESWGFGFGAYLFGFFGTDIKSPSDDGEGGLATGAVGIGVGLSPSIERGEEG